ncbi:MAG: hemolysin III family protein [Clostridia bacterium]|nr:hemolysin III family protein [Clostridia bacterium]
MKRTKIEDRKLPSYTRGEEVFNMVTHITGGAFAIAALILCIIFSVSHKNYAGLAGGIIYGLMMIFVYTISSVYHGLKPKRAKKVLQVLDHCSIYAMIAGTYMPILFTGIYSYSKKLFLILIAVLTIGTALGVTFTAIDFHRYAVIAMGGYFVIGWSIIFAYRQLLDAFPHEFMFWLLSGGIVYTLGMIFFTIGIKKRYFHSIFHIFIVAGSILQFVGIFKFCI